jgi:ATP-dependent DNA helicase RecQ
MQATDILAKYWGHKSFRTPQADIIDHVLGGNDAIALLPTGGGKSICFQVPGIILGGITIVVSPLIALMKDQVENLKSRGILATAITSEMTEQEIDAVLDRCVYDQEMRFLYLSPERLKSQIAIVRIKKMPVKLIAIDEAHCISEWGYDFRPAYLEISAIREWFPKAPMIALTASATPKAVIDIKLKLLLNKTNKLFTKSFNRENLAYFVNWEEDKIGVIRRIAEKQNGSGIIYMRSRKGTERVAASLARIGFKSDYYHAGLDATTRSERQQAWTKGQTKVIVATNAFGMGIDKPDVRFVIHLDIPETLENYYQEAGRAGRDGEKAFAISILSPEDLLRFKEKRLQRFPSKDDIRLTYQAIADQLQLAIGSGKGERFQLDFGLLMQRNKALNNFIIEQSIAILSKEGYLSLEGESLQRSRLKVKSSHETLRKVRERNPRFDRLIEALIRSYPHLFDEMVSINEWTVAKRAGTSLDSAKQDLSWLHEANYIEYQPASSLPTITFTEERLPSKSLRINPEHYDLRKEVHLEKTSWMLRFIEGDSLCRSRVISSYFGETDTKNCGICDVCIDLKS